MSNQCPNQRLSTPKTGILTDKVSFLSLTLSFSKYFFTNNIYGFHSICSKKRKQIRWLGTEKNNHKVRPLFWYNQALEFFLESTILYAF